jgi:hypothetical protein
MTFSAPNENYTKFFNKFNDINTLEVKDWNYNAIIGYFVDKYLKQYSTQYKFKYNNPAPSKCFEVFQSKRLGLTLSSDPVIQKQYIDWVFTNVIPNTKRKITSISFLNREDVQKQFKELYFKEQTISRSSQLSDSLKEMLKSLGYNMSTYGELTFFSQTDEFLKVKEQLSSLLDLNILRTIK